MNTITLKQGEQQYTASVSAGHDISIALTFTPPQLQSFGAVAAHAEPLVAGTFIGDVNRGGSCNCSTYHLTPHCNGTHTESVGHITREFFPVNAIAPAALLLAELISVIPIMTATTFAPDDRIITRELLQAQLANRAVSSTALLVRTLPNDDSKLTLNYDAAPCPAYFHSDALAWLATIGIEHLLVDTPSVDRMSDGGLLLAHRTFWGMPAGATNVQQAMRPQATITELIYVANNIVDGRYLLNLQIAPFASDAAPSRPMLYPLLNT